MPTLTLYRLRMELDAIDRVLFVPYTHYFIKIPCVRFGPGGNFKVLR